MLPRPYRLTLDSDIQLTLSQGRFLSSPLLNLKYLKKLETSNQKLETRFTVIVSRKTLKNAVDRNRAKRLVRESLRLLLPQIQSGFDMVFLPKAEIINSKQPQVQAVVQDLLSRAHIL